LKVIHFELPLKGVVNRLDDLRLTSHKVDEVNRLILEQEWKIKHSTSYSIVIFDVCRYVYHWSSRDYFLLLLLLQVL